MSPNVRSTLGAAKRALWQGEASFVYAPPRQPTSLITPGVSLVGLNRFHQSSDAHYDGLLPEPYNAFQKSGDEGLLALFAGKLAGWMWVRRGPYVEAFGCGIATIPAGMCVIRHFEVLPHARGHGIGRGMLAEATRRLRDEGGERVVAFVGTGNIASRKAFDAAGYRRLGTVTFRRILGRPIAIHIPVERDAGT